MLDIPYNNEEKEEILDRLDIIQSKLERLSSNGNITTELEYIDSVIYCIYSLDKSLSEQVKIELNKIIITYINKR